MAWTFRQLRANSTAWLHRQAVGARAQHPTDLSEQEQGCRVSSKERLDEPLPALADQNALIGAAGITVTTAPTRRNRWQSGAARRPGLRPSSSDHSVQRRSRQQPVDGASLLSSWSEQLRPPALSPCSCPICSADRSTAEFINPSGATPLTDTAVSAPGAALSLQGLADYLRVGFWSDYGSVARRYNLGSSGLNPNNGVLHYNVSGWSGDSNGLTAERQALAREAFKLYEAVLGIRFVETTSTGTEVDFFFSDNDPGRAYAYPAGTSYSQGVDYTVINIASDWHGGLSTFGSYTPQTFLHEIGHGLGLGHQGIYNYTGTALTFSTSAQFSNDSWQESMMSYWSQTQNPNTGADFAWLQTPMSVDWLALDAIYGPQGFGVNRAFQGNTTYGFNTTISASTSALWNQFSQQAHQTAYTLVDGGGYDTLDLSGFSQTQTIDLRPSDPGATAPSRSNIAGLRGNLTIAAGTIIEAAIGGSGQDSFIGNDADNSFSGNGGNDSFWDSPGSDIYRGGLGLDTLHFSESLDLLSYSTVGETLLFSRTNGSPDVDQVWNDIEIFSFAGTTFSHQTLLALLNPGTTTPAVNFAEFGQITPNNPGGGPLSAGDWLPVSFLNSYSNPVVIVSDPTFAGGQPVVARVRSINTTLSTGTRGFEVALQEFNYLDGAHISETLSYFVMESGSYALADGSRLSAGTVDTSLLSSQGFADLGVAAAGTTTLLSQVQTYNGSDAVVTRTRVAAGIDALTGSPTATHQVTMQEQESLNGGAHITETIGYVAFSAATAGSGVAMATAGSGDLLIQGGLSGGISQSGGSTSFEQAFSSTPTLLTKVSSFNGSDPANSRLTAVSASGFSAFVQEEQSLDAETTHAPEQLGFLAFGGSSGSLLGTRLDGAGAINPLLAAQPDPTILV